MAGGRPPLFPLLVAASVAEAVPVSLLFGRLAVLAAPLAAAGLLLVYILLGVLASGVLEAMGRRCGVVEAGLSAAIALAPAPAALLLPPYIVWGLLPLTVGAASAALSRTCRLGLLESVFAVVVVVAAWGAVILAGLVLRHALLS